MELFVEPNRDSVSAKVEILHPINIASCIVPFTSQSIRSNVKTLTGWSMVSMLDLSPA